MFLFFISCYITRDILVLICTFIWFLFFFCRKCLSLSFALHFFLNRSTPIMQYDRNTNITTINNNTYIMDNL